MRNVSEAKARAGVYHYYVVMRDTFMSNWGRAKGKHNYLVFCCENSDDAKIVAHNAKHRTDQEAIHILTSKPQLNENENLVQYKTKDDYPLWYQKDYFKTH